MRNYLAFLFCCISGFVLGQDQTPTKDSIVDLQYREDQFYFSAAYGLLVHRPQEVVQENVPHGLRLGFIRDFPINYQRNLAIGIGLGYATNSYFSNIRATETTSGVVYDIIPEDFEYKRSKIQNHLIEIPLEFRWRTSTPQDFKFWRVYAGMKFGYVLANQSKFVTQDETVKFKNPDVPDFQYGLMISFGYGNWNLHFSYELNPILKSGTVLQDGSPIEMHAIQLGLMFYIL